VVLTSTTVQGSLYVVKSPLYSRLMANPLDPLHQLATTNDLTNHTDDQLYQRDRDIRHALEQLPALQRQLAQARQAIANELRANRKRSWGAIAKGYGVSRTRIQQIVGGDTANAAQRRQRAQREEDPEP
jgi:DNA-directed RNA polymerase sigma subunit (sigma70/sigma32)